MSSQPNKEGNESILGNLLNGKTPGIRNIEQAYTRAGGSDHHTPGSASKLGSQDQKGASGNQGVGSAQFKEGVHDQRAEPTAIGKAFNQMINGTDKTK